MGGEPMCTKSIIKGNVPYQHSAFLKAVKAAVQARQDPETGGNLRKHEQGMLPLPASGTNNGSILQNKVEVRVRRKVIDRGHALFPAI
ncbi:hypothetical protein A0J51_00851 [Gluconobacter japonicus]|nr:hypothetical protein A0J51_00851 [Gluconobacter japonicus]